MISDQKWPGLFQTFHTDLKYIHAKKRTQNRPITRRSRDDQLFVFWPLLKLFMGRFRSLMCVFSVSEISEMVRFPKPETKETGNFGLLFSVSEVDFPEIPRDFDNLIGTHCTSID